MNPEFHNKWQSLTVTDKHAGVTKLLIWLKKFYWSYVQCKIREKLVLNELHSATG